jgi:hypothetical protein
MFTGFLSLGKVEFRELRVLSLMGKVPLIYSQAPAQSQPFGRKSASGPDLYLYTGMEFTLRHAEGKKSRNSFQSGTTFGPQGCLTK